MFVPYSLDMSSQAVFPICSLQPQYNQWMLGPMSSNYPPPPQPDQQHYGGLYATNSDAQQMLEHAQQEQLQYSDLNQPLYPKTESRGPIDAVAQQQLDSIAQNLQHHVALEEQQRQQIELAAQHLQHVSHGSPAGGITAINQQQQDAIDQAQKANRLRKACDSCSLRKVKCDESGPPCRACAALDIPCTFERPSRRRGPPNRAAEAIKRRRLGDTPGDSPYPSVGGTSSPSSPTHAAQALASLSSYTSGQQLSAESICPIETIDLLIDDYFKYIHPLCPFPHEPSFREAWKRREDLSNNPFLALLSSMLAALVASFPRKPRLHLKTQRKDKVFPNHMSLVTRCQHICAAARGIGYLERDDLNVYDAATSYLLGLAGIYTYRWRQGRLYFGECMTIIKTLGLDKSKQASYSQLGNPYQSHSADHDETRPSVDNITQEMGRRIFWTMYASIKTLEQLRASFGELVFAPPTPSNPYPPLPAEVDDFCIFPTYYEQQPPEILPRISGFNANVSVFSSYNALTTMELAWGFDAVTDWERQKQVLLDSLLRCKKAIADLPPELTLYRSAALQHTQHNGHHVAPDVVPPTIPRDPAESLLDPSHRSAHESPEETRRMQYEIQKANIHASSLATRSYIVEKYFNLCDAHDRAPTQPPNISPDARGASKRLESRPKQPRPTSSSEDIPQIMHEERENIVKDLLVVLSNISTVNCEPSADSFTMKIRSIAGTLLEASDQRKGQVALQAQEYLSAFLNILVKLERVSPANSDPDQPEDEESELRHWADLREYQLKFAQQGGFLGMS